MFETIDATEYFLVDVENNDSFKSVTSNVFVSLDSRYVLENLIR